MATGILILPRCLPSIHQVEQRSINTRHVGRGTSLYACDMAAKDAEYPLSTTLHSVHYWFFIHNQKYSRGRKADTLSIDYVVDFNL
jgi:fructoselysine-6-P-deglycase FrlB-like protein